MQAIRLLCLSAAFTVALCACPTPTPKPTPPDPVPTDGPATCVDACARMQVLGCAASAPTPEGTPCTTVCTNFQAKAGAAAWDLDCINMAPSCDAVDQCD